MNHNLILIENDLQKQMGAFGFHWFGRAATALFVAFRAIVKANNHIKKPEIILPSLSCATPANVALMAGFKVRFADVSMESGVVTLENLKERVNSNTVAVLFIYLYGNTGNIKEIKEWCTTNNIALIEDLAQALGSQFEEYQNTPGSYGDFSVFSFNKTKIIEEGGGLLISNNSKYKHEIAKSIEKLTYNDFNLKSEEILSLSYRNLHHSLVALYKSATLIETKKISHSFIQIRDLYDELYIKKFTFNSSLSKSWKMLDENLNIRYENAELYRKKLSMNADITIISQHEKSKVCWRFSFLLNPRFNVSIISELIRKDGFHVSNLYWPVNDFFYPEDFCPNAKFISKHIINLWVNSTIDKPYVVNCSNNVLKHIQQHK